MRKVLIGIAVLFVGILTACSNEPIEYSTDQLLSEITSETIEINRSFTRSELLESGCFIGIVEQEVVEEDTTYTYRKYLSFNRDFVASLVVITDILSQHFDEIHKTFPVAEDIEYVVISTETNTLSVLPTDTEELYSNDVVIIDIESVLSNDYISGLIEVEQIAVFSGFNFRDIIVAILNDEYSQEHIELLSTHFRGGYDWIDTNIVYFDIRIEETDLQQSTRFIHTETDVPTYGNVSNNYYDEIIPIDISWEDTTHDEIILSSTKLLDMIVYSYTE